MSKNYTVRDWVLLAFISFAWGSADILAKKGLQVFSPNEMGCIRIFIASLFFLPIVILQHKHIKFLQITKLLLVGLLGSVLPAFIFARSHRHFCNYILCLLIKQKDCTRHFKT